MPLTLVFRRLAPLKSPLHLKSLFSELTPLFTFRTWPLILAVLRENMLDRMANML